MAHPTQWALAILDYLRRWSRSYYLEV